MKRHMIASALLGLAAVVQVPASDAAYSGIITRTVCPSEAYVRDNFAVDLFDADQGCYIDRAGADLSGAVWTSMPVDRRNLAVPLSVKLWFKGSSNQQAGVPCLIVHSFTKNGILFQSQNRCVDRYSGFAPIGRSVTPPPVSVPAEGTTNAVLSVACVAPSTCPETMLIRHLSWRFEANGT